MAGKKLVMTGVLRKTKSFVGGAVPDVVVTEIFPVVAVGGTWALICDGAGAESGAFTPLNFTEATLVKFTPVIWTNVPGPPIPGVNPSMIGAGPMTRK